jgi:hypothetical protein
MSTDIHDTGTPQPPQPPPGQPYYGYPPPPRKKRWHKRHPVLATLGAVFTAGLLLIIIVAVALSSAANHAANPNRAAGHSAAPPAASAPPSTAPSSAAPVPSGPEMLAPGQSESIADSTTNATIGTVTVNSVSVTTQPADLSYGSRPANGYYVIVKVSATADQSYTDGFNINALDFYALSHGQQFQQDNGNAFDALSNGQSSQDITTTLGAGQTSTGWIAFDVSYPHGHIVYAPNMDGQPLAEWSY